ncbi:hypothetical protein I8G32_01383 [Rhodopseudomonas palustris]|nr:hypothetical protein [Rhodopseudomonas palustris]OPF91846.1 hypothetical protein B1S06_18125 [Rhodopseudomonas palustris]QQM02848.1 hypothetical protein I8G32_01383 [Rhodopseudomonas palustris]WAB79025.1 hypothetical protein OR798_06950 [Rhodopseudomonas palustris]WCL91487.1 hypothetical protein TX73_006945 [Rhodopseudomonas palustris CGA009]WND52923.1 hypothetical protein L1A21_06920 [Rhodopseudomonas palustris]
MRMSFPSASRALPVAQDGVFAQMRDALLRWAGRSAAAPIGGSVAAQPNGSDGLAVLAFPVRGEALLVNLARTLRARSPAAEQANDPFRLTLSSGRRLRLSIDRDAYVEYHAEDASFQLKIDAAPSRLTLETTDFAVLVNFVMQYRAERGAVPESCGVAS